MTEVIENTSSAIEPSGNNDECGNCSTISSQQIGLNNAEGDKENNSNSPKTIRGDGLEDVGFTPFFSSSQKRKEKKREKQEQLQQENTLREKGPTPLYLPRDSAISEQEFFSWTLSLAESHPDLKITYVKGKNRPYIRAEGEEDVTFLTQEGYKGVRLIPPNPDDIMTKIIIKRFPLQAKLDIVLNNPQVHWAKRNTVRGEEREQVVALWKGKVPDTVRFSPILSPHPVDVYREPPAFCLRCSRWGHKAPTCKRRVCCRFCSGGHESQNCRQKINAGIEVPPRCVNCKGDHNAHSIACPVRPVLAAPDWTRQTGEWGSQSTAALPPRPLRPQPGPTKDQSSLPITNPSAAATTNKYQEATQVPQWRQRGWAWGGAASAAPPTLPQSNTSALTTNNHQADDQQQTPVTPNSTQPCFPTIEQFNIMQENIAKLMSIMHEQQKKQTELQDQISVLVTQLASIVSNKFVLTNQTDVSTTPKEMETENECSNGNVITTRDENKTDEKKLDRKVVMSKPVLPKNITAKLINSTLDTISDELAQRLLVEVVKARAQAENLQRMVEEFNGKSALNNG